MEATRQRLRQVVGGKQLPVTIVAVALALAFAVEGFYVCFSGDDIVYSLYDTYYGGSLLRFPQWVARHWWLFNGRMPNYLLPLMLYFAPRWLLAVSNGLMAGLWVWMFGSLTCRRQCSPGVVTVLVTVATLTMTWWDTSTMYAIAFNYVWASALGLTVAWYIIRRIGGSGGLATSSVRLWLLGILGLAAGMMHEAMAMPMVFGFALYYVQKGRWRTMPKDVRCLLVWFLVGAALCLFSPGIWRRFNSFRIPDDPAWLVLLKSDYYGLLLAAVVVVMAIFRPSRLRALLATPWVIFVGAAIGSTLFCGVGGVVGRSGWFAQTSSVIALAWLLPVMKPSRVVSRALVAVFGGLFAAWLIVTTLWQIRIGSEGLEAMDRFRQSADGSFVMDFHTIDSVPWTTLKRPRGAIPNSDERTRRILQSYYHKDYIAIPAAASAVVIDDADTVVEGDGWMISGHPLATLQTGESPYQGLWRDGDGRLWNEVSYRRAGRVYYLSQPAAIHPGDRFRL